MAKYVSQLLWGNDTRVVGKRLECHLQVLVWQLERLIQADSDVLWKFDGSIIIRVNLIKQIVCSNSFTIDKIVWVILHFRRFELFSFNFSIMIRVNLLEQFAKLPCFIGSDQEVWDERGNCTLEFTPLSGLINVLFDGQFNMCLKIYVNAIYPSVPTLVYVAKKFLCGRSLFKIFV